MVAYFGLQHFIQILAQITLYEDPITLAVKNLTLLIEYVIVFQQVLAGIKVCAFYSGLGLFNRSVDDIVRNGDGIINVQSLHQTAHL